MESGSQNGNTSAEEKATGGETGAAPERLEGLRKTLSAEIRNRRTRRGLSVEAFGRLTAISPTKLNRIEEGTYAPTLEMLNAMASCLGITLHELMTCLDPLCTRQENIAEEAGPTLTEKLATALQDKRKELGMSVQDVVDKTGLSMQAVYYAESGQNNQLYNYYAIAVALQMSLASLFQNVDDHPVPQNW